MPVGFISNTFMEHVNNLAATSLAVGGSAILTNTRSWYIPTSTGLVWSGNPLDVTGIATAFYRDDVNSAHSAALSADGRIGDCKALKIQSDWLAAEERAYRTRHATSIRCSTHSAVRQIAHANGNGIYYGGVVKLIQDTLAAAYNGSDSGD